jgi:hypothetical protein
VGVAALVLGIIGTLIALFPFAFPVGMALALVGLILGIVGRKKAVEAGQPTGTATAGLVLGVVGLVIGLGMATLCGLVVRNAEKSMDDFSKQMNDPEFQKKMRENNNNFDNAFKKALEEEQKRQQEKQQEKAKPQAQ